MLIISVISETSNVIFLCFPLSSYVKKEAAPCAWTSNFDIRSLLSVAGTMSDLIPLPLFHPKNYAIWRLVRGPPSHGMLGGEFHWPIRVRKMSCSES